jgi:hypothetical protein
MQREAIRLTCPRSAQSRKPSNRTIYIFNDYENLSKPKARLKARYTTQQKRHSRLPSMRTMKNSNKTMKIQNINSTTRTIQLNKLIEKQKSIIRQHKKLTNQPTQENPSIYKTTPNT